MFFARWCMMNKTSSKKETGELLLRGNRCSDPLAEPDNAGVASLCIAA